MRRILMVWLACLAALPFFAQGNGTISPYSQYGFGTLSEQSGGYNRGMNGVGLGFREHNQLNVTNPASYSAIDSLSFLFDVGASGTFTSFLENGKRKNSRSGSVDYILAGFRAFKHVGVSFGFLPFSKTKYDYSFTSDLDYEEQSTYTNTYSGSGALSQVFLGFGWEPFKGFSLGVNGSYLWGSTTKMVTNVYSDASISGLLKEYSAKVSNYKVDFGVQISVPFNKKDKLTLGATYGLGHSLNADAQCLVVSVNTQTSVSDTTKYSVADAYKLPTMIGGGLAWNHNNQLKIGFDYTYQKWTESAFPIYEVVNDVPSFRLDNDYFLDRHKFNVGMEYCRDEYGRKFAQRIRYRLGASYTTPYYKINQADGPKEIAVSAGVALPIVNSWNNRSFLNISAQWVRNEAKGLLREDVFRISLGLTFNERWFMKWKVN